MLWEKILTAFIVVQIRLFTNVLVTWFFVSPGEKRHAKSALFKTSFINPICSWKLLRIKICIIYHWKEEIWRIILPPWKMIFCLLHNTLFYFEVWEIHLQKVCYEVEKKLIFKVAKLSSKSNLSSGIWYIFWFSVVFKSKSD